MAPRGLPSQHTSGPAAHRHAGGEAAVQAAPQRGDHAQCGVSGAGVGGGWNVAQALGTSRGVSGRSLGKYVGTRL